MIARLKAGDLVMKARSMDVPRLRWRWWSRELFQDPFMVLRPHAPGGGWFRPENWHGNEPPPGLPYIAS